MKCETEYSVISNGTEKYSNKGYISISKIKGNYRFIQDIDHGILESKINDHSLKVNKKYSIENIVLSRFELIPALFFKKNKVDDNILICGCGNIGYSTCIYLINHGYKNITIYNRNNIIPYQLSKRKVKSTNKIESGFNTYIDTTGSSDVLKEVFNNSSYFNNIIILSTPRDEKYLIDPLQINQKNLKIYGGHEINGYTNKYRNAVLFQLLKENINENLEGIINYSLYSKNMIIKLRNVKKFIFNVIKY